MQPATVLIIKEFNAATFAYNETTAAAIVEAAHKDIQVLIDLHESSTE